MSYNYISILHELARYCIIILGTFFSNVASVRLRGRLDRNNVRDYHGTVQLYNSKKNRFEFICDEGWDINDAHVICRMLGFSGALDAIVRSQYGEPRARYASLSNVQCNGTESSIFDCPYKSNPNCFKSRCAGVRCLSKFEY